MSERTPRHLRGLPPGLELTPEEEREHMDLQTALDRDRRQREAQRDPSAPEPWAFAVPRPMALLFDALPSPFTIDAALEAGAALGLDEAAVAEALHEMRARELVSDGPEGLVKHPDGKGWF